MDIVVDFPALEAHSTRSAGCASRVDEKEGNVPIRAQEDVYAEFGDLEAEVGHGCDDVLVALEERRSEVLPEVANGGRDVGTDGQHAVLGSALPAEAGPPGAVGWVAGIVESAFPEDSEPWPEEDIDLDGTGEYIRTVSAR